MCVYVFLAVLRLYDSIGCCQNRRKISGDRNACPSPKGIPQPGRQVGRGLPRILKILLPLQMRKAFGKAKTYKYKYLPHKVWQGRRDGQDFGHIIIKVMASFLVHHLDVAILLVVKLNIHPILMLSSSSMSLGLMELITTIMPGVERFTSKVWGGVSWLHSGTGKVKFVWEERAMMPIYIIHSVCIQDTSSHPAHLKDIMHR